VLFGFFGRNVEHQYEVGRVSRRAERSTASARLVDRAAVDRRVPELLGDARVQPDDGQTVVEDLGQRLAEHHRLAVPSSSLDVQTLNYTRKRGFLRKHQNRVF